VALFTGRYSRGCCCCVCFCPTRREPWVPLSSSLGVPRCCGHAAAWSAHAPVQSWQWPSASNSCFCSDGPETALADRTQLSDTTLQCPPPQNAATRLRERQQGTQLCVCNAHILCDVDYAGRMQAGGSTAWWEPAAARCRGRFPSSPSASMSAPAASSICTGNTAATRAPSSTAAAAALRWPPAARHSLGRRMTAMGWTLLSITSWVTTDGTNNGGMRCAAPQHQVDRSSSLLAFPVRRTVCTKAAHKLGAALELTRHAHAVACTATHRRSSCA
jgi:hypothetical protein